MITLIQINKGINETIENALVNTDLADVPIKPEDTKEVFKKETDGSTISVTRPSIKVQLEKDNTGKLNSCTKERTLTVRVYFFAKDRYKYRVDNLKMRDILVNAFLEDIKITDTFYMPITEDGVECSVTDSVLQCSFDLYSLEEIVDTTEYEPMEELILDL